MLKPNPNARLSARPLVSLRLVKKVTVMGNIGNTQGVTTAIKPPRKAKRRKPSKELSLPPLTPLEDGVMEEVVSDDGGRMTDVSEGGGVSEDG